MASSSSSTSEKLCRRFSLAEIQSATRGFSDKHVIGEGGFGKVYKGRIDNGSVTVAIKRLSKKQGKADDAKQGEKEFAAEMETLTKVRHHNLVSLIGYCDDEEEQTKQKEMILVYEYMANGTLADHLYKLSRSSDASSPLSWNQRLKICIGAGRGLDYLHSGCSIIHRDVKPTNILLDEHWTAKVADFGLAKQLSKDMLQSHVSTMIKGTFGYFDPSYFTTGRLTRASDTYAFGVILLEVLSEKPALGRNVVEDQLPMSIWAQEKIRSGKANQIVASDLKDQISEDCLKTFVGVAKKCLHQKPEKRLTMTRAVAQLELALEQQEMNGMTSYKLKFGPLSAIWRKGSRQKDQKEVDIEKEFGLENQLQLELALEQQERKGKATHVLQFWPLRSRPGSTQKDEPEPEAIPFRAIENKHTVDMEPSALRAEPKKRVTMTRVVAQLELVIEQQDRKGRDATYKLQFSPFSNRVIPSGSTQKNHNEKVIPAFPLAELKDITKVFNSNCLVANGSGGGSAVFHGVLKTGQHAAIKKFYKKLPYRTFLAQALTIYRLKHENVVDLLGYCDDGGLHILVYEFAPRGSLYDILHGPQELTLAQIIAAAKGLKYIHDKALIHRNINSSNILLFDGGIAKISDLRLSTECTCAKAYHRELPAHAFTVPPCFRYHPPEFQRDGHSQKGDVYSFGMVLFELFVQRISIAREGVYAPSKAVEKVSSITANCLERIPDRRPSMIAVLTDLQLALRLAQVVEDEDGKHCSVDRSVERELKRRSRRDIVL